MATQFVCNLAKKIGKSKAEAADVVAAVFATIQEMTKEGQTVRIDDFGMFKEVTRAARTVRSPLTGVCALPERVVLSFKPSKNK